MTIPRMVGLLIALTVIGIAAVVIDVAEVEVRQGACEVAQQLERSCRLIGRQVLQRVFVAPATRADA